MLAYTCLVIAHAVMASGNRPVFADIDLVDCSIDISTETGSTHMCSKFPNAAQATREMTNLPCCSYLREDDAQYIVTSVLDSVPASKV